MSAYQQVQLQFERIGAIANIREIDVSMPGRVRPQMSIDVTRAATGECFDIRLARQVQLAVLDRRARERHLLLSARSGWSEDRFLCGHDEQHWFVATIDHAADAQCVAAAKEALRPNLVARMQERRQRGKHWRRGDVCFRQGEWFFIPCRHAPIAIEQIEHDAVLVRGPGGQPHQCQFMFRDGEREYECPRYPKLAFFETEYQEILRTRRKAKQWKWRLLPFGGNLYVKGFVTHPDHSPLYLDVWCRVELNREARWTSLAHMNYRD